MQKLLFGLLMASGKMRHYFQAHEITVVTRLPLQRILHNPDATGRIVEWALELSSFGLKFESTSKIQSRVLAEFVAEWTATPDEETQETALLSIYTIAMQAAGARDEKVLANYFPLALKPNIMSWLMHLPVDSISS